jgi:transcription elongation factor Elf1
MAKKGQPGRDIYDKIKMLPENDTCPFCGHRDVSTLDHVLPKADYPIFAVTPLNLVGSCGDCNKLKLAAVPSCASDTLLHPYFDAASDRQWLSARVVAGPTAAVTFYVLQVAQFNASLNARIAHQFRFLGLARLYSSQAAREIAGIRANLKRHHDSGGLAAVRLELRHQFESRQASQINSWQTATYQALSQSDWFCDGGFSLL